VSTGAFESCSNDLFTDIVYFCCREDAFGAVVYSFAVAEQPSKARKFLEDMLTGTYGDNVKPGASCYNAAILSYVRAGAWNDVLSLYGTMKESRVKANPTTFNGVLLASHQVGGSSQVHALAEELLSTSAALGQESCQLILDILIPELQRSDARVDTRKQLRLLVDQDPGMSQVYLNLHRALHTAETEQSRKPSNGLSNEDIAQRRDTAWRDVLRIILSCAQATEDQKGQAT
jgi:pentatricopeptide repeat protein